MRRNLGERSVKTESLFERGFGSTDGFQERIERVTELPLTPERIWQAMEAAQSS